MAESHIGAHGPRLGYCEVCDIKAAIYTCPKCEVKTCSLGCVRVHKAELNCDGVRDRTKFIQIKDFTDRDYLQDYQLLEECARFLFAVKRDEKKKYTRIEKNLPIHLYKLKMAARQRGVALQFLAQNFSRHQVNTTRYNYKTDLISWKVEWIFANAEPPLNMVDTKCLENVKLVALLDKYLGPDSNVVGGSALAPYKAVGYPGIKVLMRAEKVKGCAHKFFELDLDESLAECLSGKCVVEYPTFMVVFKDHAYNFDIVPDDLDLTDDVQDNNEAENDDANNARNTGNRFFARKRQLLTEKVAIQKERAIQKEIDEERRKKPRNLLFTTGFSSEEEVELSDDET